MWVIVPVKQFREAKNRLSGSLSGDQRANLSKLMVMDVLGVLSTSDVVDGITVVSAEPEMIGISERYRAEHILTDTDSGQSVDVAYAISSLAKSDSGKIAILPSDVPDLSHADLRQLESAHQSGVTLCPAPMDGGTNGLVFSPPLPIPLLYGKESLKKFQEEAARQGVEVSIARIPGLERDIDRLEDLEWLREQPTGGHAWAFSRDLILEQR
jgi:2-phospho-L-lactate guanylyltransferase